MSQDDPTVTVRFKEYWDLEQRISIMENRIGAISFLFMVILLQVHFVAMQAAGEEAAGQSVTESSKSKASGNLKKQATKPASQIVDHSTPALDQAARKKIWNSPEMKKARGWVDDYLRVTNKYTPEQKAEFERGMDSVEWSA